MYCSWYTQFEKELQKKLIDPALTFIAKTVFN